MKLTKKQIAKAAQVYALSIVAWQTPSLDDNESLVIEYAAEQALKKLRKLGLGYAFGSVWECIQFAQGKPLEGFEYISPQEENKRYYENSKTVIILK